MCVLCVAACCGYLPIVVVCLSCLVCSVSLEACRLLVCWPVIVGCPVFLMMIRVCWLLIFVVSYLL